MVYNYISRKYIIMEYFNIIYLIDLMILELLAYCAKNNLANFYWDSLQILTFSVCVGDIQFLNNLKILCGKTNFPHFYMLLSRKATNWFTYSFLKYCTCRQILLQERMAKWAHSFFPSLIQSLNNYLLSPCRLTSTWTLDSGVTKVKKLWSLFSWSLVSKGGDRNQQFVWIH